MKTMRIAPSILSADFARLGEEVRALQAGGADLVHVDVMDNHYVPNLTIGPMVCQALRKHGVTAPIDVHLMVEPVDRIVPDFAEAGASLISFHPEASRHVHRTVQLIRSHGCQAGLVLNPATPVEVLDWVLEDLDMVLLMSVNPGFGGQAFIPSTLDKLRAVRAMIDKTGKPIRLEIDGGVKADNIGEIAAAGADTFVAGSAIFGAPRTRDCTKERGPARAHHVRVVGQTRDGELPRCVARRHAKRARLCADGHDRRAGDRTAVGVCDDCAGDRSAGGGHRGRCRGHRHAIARDLCAQRRRDEARRRAHTQCRHDPTRDGHHRFTSIVTTARSATLTRVAVAANAASRSAVSHVSP